MRHHDYSTPTLPLSAAVQLRAALEVYPGEEQAYLAYGQVLQALARVAIAKDDQSGASSGARWLLV